MFLCVFSEVIIDGDILSQDGCSKRCMKLSFLGMYFLTGRLVVKLRMIYMSIIDNFRASEHFLRHC